jgi:hypothetical protein
LSPSLSLGVSTSIKSAGHFSSSLALWRLLVRSSAIGLGEQDNEARRLGFLDAPDMRAAREAGIVDPAAWQSRREQLAKQREAERVEAERAKDTRLPALHGQPNIVVPARNASASQPFVVTIETAVSNGARPIVTGTTNLPDGTHLWMRILKPYLPNAKERLAVGLAACEDNCLPFTTTNDVLQDEVVVKNGKFSDGPFTDKGAALSPNTYILEISLHIAAIEPPDVHAIIGSLGENMTGPLVGACCFGNYYEPAAVRVDEAFNSWPSYQVVA